MQIKTDTFPTDRARRYIREALVLGVANNEPAVYLQGGWSVGKGRQPRTQLTQDQQDQIRNLVSSFGYDGCQILPGPHFTMNDIKGNVYGCEPGGFNGLSKPDEQPLDYIPALSRESVARAVSDLAYANGLSPLQENLVSLALGQVSQKMATVEAFQLTEQDGVVTLVTRGTGGGVETTVEAGPGDWVVRQANGVIQRISEQAFPGLGYVLKGTIEQ